MENVKVAETVVETISTAEGDPTSQQPVETVKLIPGKVTWKVTPIKPDNSKDGVVEAAFDQVANA